MSTSRFAIAIVDDEEPVRKALGRLLRAAGFDVETFNSGLEFFDSLRTRRPDCTILDIHLPGISGLELQRRLRREEIKVPCVMVTGKDEPGLDTCVRAAGAVAYLKKPFDEQTLLAAIASAVPGHQPREHTGHREPEAPGAVSSEIDGVS